jgi:hypothetical protein
MEVIDMPTQESGQCRKCGGDIFSGMDGLCEECLLRLYQHYLKRMAELTDASVQTGKKTSPVDEVEYYPHLFHNKYTLN